MPKCGHPPSVEAVNDIESFIGVGMVNSEAGSQAGRGSRVATSPVAASNSTMRGKE